VLTIITPCFNSERFIAHCVEKLAAQIGTLPVEHLIMDGASRDRTLEILAGYQARFPHLRVVSEPDKGQSDAMNKGITLAKYRTISFLNVDDFMEPSTVADVIARLKNAPDLHFLVGNCNLRSLDGKILAVNRPHQVAFERLMLESPLFPFPSNPSAYFYDRRLHELVGPYDVSLRYTMDLEFILRMSRVAKVRYVDAVWGNFVLHEDCKTASNGNSGQVEMATFMQRFRAELDASQRLRLRLWRLVTEPHRGFLLLSTLARRIVGRLRRMISPPARIG
jgi:glycosyltransferase involved in cell wall biosynthesis